MSRLMTPHIQIPRRYDKVYYIIRLSGKNREAFPNWSENGLREWGKETGFRFLFWLGVRPG